MLLCLVVSDNYTKCATDYVALALAMSLDKEISPLGLRSICFEFGYFVSNIFTPGNMRHGASHISAYDKMTERTEEYIEGVHIALTIRRTSHLERLAAMKVHQLGDPGKAAELIVDVARGEGVAAGKDIPPFIAVGSDAYREIADELASAQHKLEDWKELTCSTNSYF